MKTLNAPRTEQLRHLPGPEWLASRRASAVAQLSSVSFPTEAEEIWRYSRIGSVTPSDFSAARSAVEVLLPDDAVAAGVQVRRAVAFDVDPIGAPLIDDACDAVTLVGASVLTDVVVIDVPPGAVAATPIHIRHHLQADGAVIGTRLVIRSGPNSDVTVIERTTSDDVATLLIPITELHLDAAARLRFVSVQELGRRVVQLGMLSSRSEKDSTLTTIAVALGGSYARMRTDSTLTGRGAHSEMLAVYFGDEAQMHDFRTIQSHISPNATSDLLFKGGVKDRARSVYSGLIRIGPDARGTVANQANRNLLLSAEASAESVPNLEIENNDVKCSHASAVGPIDEDHLYYLESRGVPSDVAERLVVIGFFADLLDRVPEDSLRADLIDAVRMKFDKGASR